MKEIKNMKKWFIALAALALLLIPSVALAEKETDFFCYTCHAERTGIVSDTYEYSDSTYHVQRIQCTVCKNAGQVIGSRHTESIAATCQSAAYCDVCKSNYGAPAEHNWGAWTKADGNQHVSTCQNSGCNQTQSGEHSGGNATCSTEGTCAICHGSYKSSDNHVGSYTYSYESSPSSARQHRVTETCTGCGKASRIYDEDHQLEPQDGKTPTCMESGWEAYQTCKYCPYTTYSALNSDPNAHIGTATTTYAKTSETEHTPTTTYSGCKHLVVGTPEAHTQTTPATCTAAAYCGDCKAYYGSTDPDAHNLVQHDAKAPTCTEVGWEAYEICTRADCTYSTYQEIPALGHDYAAKTTPATCTTDGYTTYTCAICKDSYRGKKVPALQHWYAEWTPNGSATHSAPCKRDCDKIGSTDCAAVAYALLTGEVRTEFMLCPVCGEINQVVAVGGERIPRNDACLLLVEDAAAQALTERLPAGEVVVRTGALESGEVLMSVAFEISGKMTQPTGLVKLSLPAGALNGHSLYLIDADGTETPIDLEIDADTASFTLDFTESQTPSRLLRLLPQA